MRRVLARLDDAMAQVERAVVLAFLAVMALVVFFDVVHRVASTPEGLLLKLLLLLAGGDPSEATLATLRTTGVPALVALLTFALYAGALRTRGGDRLSLARVLLFALGLTALTAGALWLLLTVFPNGLVWSQPLSLGLLLWVALLGATLATKAKGHIVLEIADRVWPAPLLPLARLASGLLASLFCLVVAILAAHYVADFVEQWREGVGYLSGVALPKWLVYLALPVGFLLMGLRFGAYAVADFQRRGQPHVVEVRS